MVSAATRLKHLRERTEPRLTVRGLAELLGMPWSSYARYETAADFKKPFLPLPLATKIAEIFADHGIPAGEVMALAGVGEGQGPSVDLSASEQHWLDIYRRLTSTQRSLLLGIAGEMVEPAGGNRMPPPSTVHSPALSYKV